MHRDLFDFTLTSLAFQDGQVIPSKYNATVSPPLQWSEPPETTQSYVLIVEDIDAPNPYMNWIVYNIPATVRELEEGILVWPDGTVLLRNGEQRFRYDGPSPRDGKKHRYVFRLVALSVKTLDFPGTGRATSLDDLRAGMKPYILKETKLMGTYDAKNHDQD
jgi:Raf kinase inhibitor-like YbhB/YbcL family protein